MISTEQLNELRFPIGKFHWPTASLSSVEREVAVNIVARTPSDLRLAVAGLSPAQFDTPYRPDGWTVRQVVHHLADSHMNAYVRFKLALTEDEPTVKPYEEALWAKLSDVKETQADVSLNLLVALHIRWVNLLRSLGDGEYARTLRHPEHGKIRLDQLLAMYAWHGSHHVAHITSLRRRSGW